MSELENLSDEVTFRSTSEAAAYLKISPRTLEKYRVEGGGPIFIKLGHRVTYLTADLQAWAMAKRCRSTSDPAWQGRRSATSQCSISAPVAA